MNRKTLEKRAFETALAVVELEERVAHVERCPALKPEELTRVSEWRQRTEERVAYLEKLAVGRACPVADPGADRLSEIRRQSPRMASALDVLINAIASHEMDAGAMLRVRAFAEEMRS